MQFNIEASFEYVDLKMAALVEPNREHPVFVLTALLNVYLRSQHTCLPLEMLNWQDSTLIAVGLSDKEKAIQVLLNHESTQPGGPLVLVNEQLYFARFNHYEVQLVAHFMRMNEDEISIDDEQLKCQLHQYFGNNDTLDWQKIACAVAALKRFSIISGGPGTGKTTTVTKLLAVLQSLYQKTPLSITLVAPTGKAAARLSESIRGAKQSLALDNNIKGLIPDTAQTIHRLLGVIPHSNKFRHHKNKQLKLDLLVIDEASMVDLALMNKLFDALPAHARVVMLGDKDQLSSVDTGNVLADLCRDLTLTVDHRYSHAFSQRLNQVCDHQITQVKSCDSHYLLNDGLAFLQFSHRFSSDSGIGQLAKAVNFNDKKRLNEIKHQAFPELAFYDVKQAYREMIVRCANAYHAYLDEMKAGESMAQVHRMFLKYQMLAAVKRGPYGVETLNHEIESTLARQGKINHLQRHYAGLPIMITQNDYQLGLFNGDIGILNHNYEGELMAYFIMDGGDVMSFSPARLPSHDKVYAMTIHKSQGSEFEHVAMVLPPIEKAQRGVNRQLVYTGITRAKLKIDIIAEDRVLVWAMSKGTERYSGLYERLVIKH